MKIVGLAGESIVVDELSLI
jgi:hypothetical protein